jgi:hypothetical protein
MRATELIEQPTRLYRGMDAAGTPNPCFIRVNLWLTE